MRRFAPVDSLAALLDQDSIDTDQIIPSAFMRGIEPDYAAGLFALWRRDPAFILNQPGYGQAAILVSGQNFGCGSTREQAAWALAAFGIRVLVAGSFGEVFRDNCIKNGILPIALLPEALAPLRALLRAAPTRLHVDLQAQTLVATGHSVPFDIPLADKAALLEGLDEVGMTLLQDAAIATWEQREQAARPWRQTLRRLP